VGVKERKSGGRLLRRQELRRSCVAGFMRTKDGERSEVIGQSKTGRGTDQGKLPSALPACHSKTNQIYPDDHTSESAEIAGEPASDGGKKGDRGEIEGLGGEREEI